MRFFLYFFCLLVVIQVMPGINSSSLLATLLAALVLSVLNLFLKPVLLILTIPINLLTLGLFTFVVNGILLYLTSGLVPGFNIIGFWSAFWGAILFSIALLITNNLLKDKQSGNRPHHL